MSSQAGTLQPVYVAPQAQPMADVAATQSAIPVPASNAFGQVPSVLAKQGSSSSSSPSPSTIVSGVKNAFGDAAGTIKNGINSVGGDLGFGAVQAAPSASFVGPMPMTGAITNTPLTGVLGGAGIGGIVGSVNPLSHGSTAGNVGGMIGGAIGAAAGFGPVGQVVGGFIGSSLGGLFGGSKKPGVHASEFQTGVIEGNDYTSATGYGTKRADTSQAKEVHEDFTNYLKDISSKYGADFTGAAFRGGYNDLHQGGWFLSAKTDMKGGDPDTSPNSWYATSYDPKSDDKYKTYSSVALKMLASQGRLTPELAEKIKNDTGERIASSTVRPEAPRVAAKKEQTGTTFAQFVQDYRNKQNQGIA